MAHLYGMGMSFERIEFVIGVDWRLCYAVFTYIVIQLKLIMVPDRLAQVIEQFDNGHCLLCRPILIDDEGDALPQSRG